MKSTIHGSVNIVRITKRPTTPAVIARLKAEITELFHLAEKALQDNRPFRSDRYYDRAKALEGLLPDPKQPVRAVLKKREYTPDELYDMRQRILREHRAWQKKHGLYQTLKQRKGIYGHASNEEENDSTA